MTNMDISILFTDVLWEFASDATYTVTFAFEYFENLNASAHAQKSTFIWKMSYVEPMTWKMSSCHVNLVMSNYGKFHYNISMHSGDK